jgi:hypothetical protein
MSCFSDSNEPCKTPFSVGTFCCHVFALNSHRVTLSRIIPNPGFITFTVDCSLGIMRTLMNQVISVWIFVWICAVEWYKYTWWCKVGIWLVTLLYSSVLRCLKFFVLMVCHASKPHPYSSHRWQQCQSQGAWDPPATEYVWCPKREGKEVQHGSTLSTWFATPPTGKPRKTQIGLGLADTEFVASNPAWASSLQPCSGQGCS